MVKSFMLSVQITEKDSHAIKNHLKGWRKLHETDCYCSTYSYTNNGFSNIRLYDFVNKSLRKIHFMTITVNPSRMKSNTVSYLNNGYELNTFALREYIIRDFLPPLTRYPKFLLRNIIFSLDLSSGFTSMYMQLFQMGFSLQSWNMKQRIFVNDTEIETIMQNAENLDEIIRLNEKYVLHYKGKSASLNMVHHVSKPSMEIMDSYFNQPSDKNHGYIHIEIKIEKFKIQNLMKKFGIENRKLYDFSKDGFLKELEKQLFVEYIGRITRKGNYYGLEEASRIIESVKMNKTKKRRLIEVLQLISNSNGIDNFLKLISAGSIDGYSKLSTIEEYFRNYDKLEINPVLLPCKFPKSSLKNPLKLLEDFYDNSFDKKSLMSKPKAYNRKVSSYIVYDSIIGKIKIPKDFNPDPDCGF